MFNSALETAGALFAIGRPYDRPFVMPLMRFGIASVSFVGVVPECVVSVVASVGVQGYSNGKLLKYDRCIKGTYLRVSCSD